MRLLLVGVVACATSEPAKPQPPPPATAIRAPGLRLPDGVTPLAYRLELDVDPDRDTFRGDVHIRVRLDRPTRVVWLHMVDLDVSSARFDGGELHALDVKGDQMRAFDFGRTLPRGEHELAFAYIGHATRDEQGLFRQRVGTHSYLFSQGQSVFARRIAPCFDEPRFKTPWQVTLTVPRDQVALANTPEQRSETLPHGKKRIAFAPTRPMASYLLAIAVGPFDMVDAGTVGKNRVPVRVAVHAGAAKQVGVADKLPAIVSALEAYTDDALPLAKLDLVGVPHLFGAMENPGLITFDEAMLIGSASRRPFVRNFIEIAAHELVHQWFGNLVTPAWWDDLWISESFASWLGDKIARDLGALDNPTLHYARLRHEALDADAGVDAIPLRRPIKGNGDPDDAFDAIAYAKGEIVLATFEAWLGADRMRDILRGYLRAHRDGTATTRDLVAAIGAAEPDAAKAFEQFATTVGAPVVELSLRCDAKPAVIASAREHRLIPICVRPASAQKPACVLVGERTELTLAPACPKWLIGNAATGYYHVAWTDKAPRPPLAQLDEAGRMASGEDVAAAVRRGELTAKQAIGELRALAAMTETSAQLGAVAIAAALDEVVDDATRPAWTSWLRQRFAVALARRPHTRSEFELSDAVIALLGPYGERAGDLFELVGAHGDDDKVFTRMVDRARVSRDDDDRRRYLALLGELPPPFAAKLASLPGGVPALPIAPIWAAMRTYFARPAARSTAWHALQPQIAVFARRMPVDDVAAATATLCSKPERDEVAAAFPAGGPKLARALAAIDRCIARRAQLGDIAAVLR